MAEIRVSKDGPYLVSGDLPLTVVTIGANDEGESVRFEWGRKLPHKAQVGLLPLRRQRQQALLRRGPH